jgi:hypothetical protein
MSCSDDVICSCIEKLIYLSEAGKIIGYKISEKLIQEGVKVCNTRHLECLRIVKVRQEYKYFAEMYAIFRSSEFSNFYDNVIVVLNPKIALCKLIGLIRSIVIYTKVKVSPACIYPQCYQMLFRQDSSDASIADRMYFYLSSLASSENEINNHCYSMLYFLEAYYIACTYIVNKITVIKEQIITCRKQNKITALQLSIGFIKDRKYTGGHMGSLIFENDPSDNKKSICEIYDPSGLNVGSYINIPEIEKFLKVIFGDSVSYVNMMDKLANPVGVQKSSNAIAIETNNTKFNQALCTIYSNYYIYKRFKNPGNMEKTYFEMLTYYKEHSQDELFKWIIDIIRSCKTKTGNLWNDVRKTSSFEDVIYLLRDYYAELTRYNEDEIAISSSIDIMKKRIM